MKYQRNEIEREEFGQRLELALSNKAMPTRSRVSTLQEWTGVGREGCRKWIKGQSVPEKPVIRILAESAHLNVREEWLEWGIPPMERDDQEPLEGERAQLLREFDQLVRGASEDEIQDLAAILRFGQKKRT